MYPVINDVGEGFDFMYFIYILYFLFFSGKEILVCAWNLDYLSDINLNDLINMNSILGVQMFKGLWFFNFISIMIFYSSPAVRSTLILPKL